MKNLSDENQNSSTVATESPRPAPVVCVSCQQLPESNGTQARCSTENCFLRSMMGWMSERLWNSSMHELAVARVQQSASSQGRCLKCGHLNPTNINGPCQSARHFCSEDYCETGPCGCECVGDINRGEEI
jgi:hypothetical protein